MGNEVAKISPTDADSVSRRRTVMADVSTSATKGTGTEGQTKHQFTWYYPNWESYLDETGNIYYYNDVIKETIWDPAEIYGGPNYTGEDIEWDSNSPAPSLGNTGKAISFSNTNSTVLDYQARRAVQMEERKENLAEDHFVPWKELASVGHMDPDVIEEHVSESSGIALSRVIRSPITAFINLFMVGVVAQVSEGCFEPELLYKLPWAYKVQQLGAAVRESYLEVGDMFDSSKYDNCNDVPRYDDGGLVSWWNDLEDLHFAVVSVIDSGVVGQESEHYTEEMKKLQAIAATGNEDEMLEGFLARKIEVEKELSGLRARYVITNQSFRNYMLFGE